MDEQFPKSALDKFRQWHFWWLVIFSLLLIVTFVYYLPTSFLQQAEKAESMPHDHPGEAAVVDESQPHSHDTSGNSVPNASPAMGAMSHDDMHQHMEEHMSGGMSMDDMMTHMAKEHGMTDAEAKEMMDEMMAHEHDSTGATPAVHEHVSNGGAGGYQEEASIKDGLAINLNISPVPYNVGVPLNMDFFVNQKPGNVPILASKLQIEHEKLMHVIGVRSDMNGFFHIHPEFLADNPAIFSVDHTFDKPGLYKIWSEVKKGGADYIIGHPEVSINGSGPKEEKKVSFSRNVITDGYQVSLKVSDAVSKGKEVDLSFDIHTLTGQEIDVEPYLGANMHLTIIRDDLKQFIHTHPEGHVHSQIPGMINVALAHGGVEDEPAGATEEHQTTVSGDETIDFKVTFPEAGLYKAFAQFRPKGINLPADKAILAEFWIQVEEKAPFPVSQWWLLLVVSAVLMAVLSWWVNKYLKVKPEDIKIKK